ncbi:hypothetical protein NM688_g781 [Phlebia brevispora]|uniref:Uncharacterized protein n=1 Tax=Phlebia brevispora TaxID=194682 RepID=A0ACC1TDI1_9APHY|nr:hypothetical protein NM688_g781 [Phlebia brevispora]
MAVEKRSVSDEASHSQRRACNAGKALKFTAITLAAIGFRASLELLRAPIAQPGVPALDFTHLSDHCAHVKPIPVESYISRQDELAKVLHDLSALAYIAEPGANAAYYANISSSAWGLSERPLLLILTPYIDNSTVKGNISVLTPKFEATRARLLPIPSDEEIAYPEWPEDADPYKVAVAAIPALQQGGPIYVDGSMRLFVSEGIQNAAPASAVVAAPVEVRELRERKSADELEIMKCVNEARTVYPSLRFAPLKFDPQVTVLAIRAARKAMHIGMRESEARSLVESALRASGLKDAFALTLFGPNAALPHGSGTDRVLQQSDFILVDCGGSLYGYRSDVTRTFALEASAISTDHLELWDLVFNAQTAAINTAKNGTVAKDVDKAARHVIGEEGFEFYFTHRLGHGIGLEVHESPYLRGGSEDIILTGMTFSDEPGVYIEGDVGVRLEDCFYIDDTGKAVFLTDGVGGQAEVCRPVSLQEVAQHSSVGSCWVIIRNKVYDVTNFLPEHPGGSQIILKYAGRDATDAFEPIHAPDVLERYLPRSNRLGEVDSAAVSQIRNARESKGKTEDEVRMEQEHATKPPLNRILNLQEMENVARRVLSKKALAYYSSASDDEISYQENARAFSQFFFLPRVLRPLSTTDPSTTILGFKSSIPVFVSAAGLAKLGHPLGEANITRGAGHTGIIQMVSSSPSLSYAQIAESRISPDQPLFFQLYKHKDDAQAERRVREVERLGYKAIFLTVDAVHLGNRERDIRAGWELDDMERMATNGVQKDDIPKKELPRKQEDLDLELEELDLTGTAGALIAKDDTDMTWEVTIPWLRGITKLPIGVKGIQCVEDAVLAAEAGVDAILLSNHGGEFFSIILLSLLADQSTSGRQLEYALPPIDVLYKLRRQRPEVFDKLEVYVDGGVKRGTDVVKALCLGARSVGLGRPFLYAQSAYGAAGVARAVRILEREIISCMRQLGVRKIEELVPKMVCASQCGESGFPANKIQAIALSPLEAGERDV